MNWRQDFLTDLLSDETRRRKRNLEIIAVVALLVVLLGLVPTRVSALGVELDKPDQRGVVWTLLILVCGFLAAFVIYALSDLDRARTLMDQVQAEIEELHGNVRDRTDWIVGVVEGRHQPEHGLDQDVNEQVAAMAANVMHIRNRELLKVFGWLRILVEFVAPIGLAVAAIVALAGKLA